MSLGTLDTRAPAHVGVSVCFGSLRTALEDVLPIVKS